MCLEQCPAVGASQKLLYSRLFFTHCHSLTALGWQNVQQVLPPRKHFWPLQASGGPACLLLCSSIFLTLLDQPVAHSARGTAEPRAHLTTNHQSLIVMHLQCCLQCRSQSLNNSNSFIKFSQRSLGCPEVSGLALFSLAVVQIGRGGIRL